MYFPSKKDIWFFLIYWGLMAIIVLLYIFGGEPVGLQLITYKSMLGYFFTSVIIIFLLWIWFGTGYKIEDGLLQIRYGPLRSQIKIEEITKIRRTKNPFTAPALSIYRLQITYGKYEVVDISPKDEKAFLNALLKKNPTIKLEDISI